jgi:hypothetical protein
MVKRDPVTLSTQAANLSSVGRAYTELASKHRVLASALQRGVQKRVDHASHFDNLIMRAAELSAAAERLLALEIELARNFGVTWEEIASTLGVTRQAAWDRFARPSRLEKSRRISQLRLARRAELLREVNKKLGRTDEELSAFEEWLEKRSDRRQQGDR